MRVEAGLEVVTDVDVEVGDMKLEISPKELTAGYQGSGYGVAFDAKMRHIDISISTL